MTAVNIATHLKSMMRTRPDRLAVMVPAGRDRSGETTYASYSYEQLDDESDALAAGFAALKIGRGVKTVLMVPPSLEFFALTFGLFKVGAIPVLVDPGMGMKNLGQCLSESEPEAFIGVTRAHVARLLFGWARQSLKRHVTVGRRLGWGGHTLRQVAVAGRKSLHRTDSTDLQGSSTVAETQSDEMAAILFTSGSTGVPKGAVYSHGNFAAQLEAPQQAFDIQPGEIDLCTFPLFALFAPALGMTAIVPRMDFTKPARVNPREIEQPVQRFQVNNLFGSPALLNRVGRDFEEREFWHGHPVSPTSSPKPPPLVWTTVRRVLSAGAPVPAANLERFSKLLPPDVQIFTPYGATESLPVAVIGSHEILRETRYLTEKGAGTCVGKPVPSVEVAIIKITDEPIAEWNETLPLPVGTIGEIVVHGPMVTQAYYRRPELTALAKIRDPATGRMRHRMGDLGYLDERGRLWFCGRKSQRVITSERTLFTEPVEGIFNSHPAVFRSALVGVRRNGDIEPVICIERESHLALGKLIRPIPDSMLQDELLELGARFEQTQSIRTILFHPSFPVDIRHNSKIFREKLAPWAARKLK